MYLQNTLEGLAVGYKITKYAKFFTSARWGCILIFRWDAELADAYYLEHYANTNKTMVICTPHIPMEANHFKNKAKTKTMNSMIVCNYYQLGYLKWLYKQRDWSYIWNTSGGVPLRVALVAAGMITITGVFGEYIPSELPRGLPAADQNFPDEGDANSKGEPIYYLHGNENFFVERGQTLCPPCHCLPLSSSTSFSVSEPECLMQLQHLSLLLLHTVQ